VPETKEDSQLQAIMDAQDADPALLDLNADEVSKALKERGHHLFVDEELPDEGRKTLEDVAESKLLPVVEGDPFAVGAGLGDFGHGDVRIPTLKIKQAQTQDADEVPDGSLFITSDPDGHSETRELILLELGKERSLLLPYGGGAPEESAREALSAVGVDVPGKWEGPVCSSRDRKAPEPNVDLAPVSTSCSSCPMGKWDRKTRSQPCRESYKLLLVDAESQLPATFYARGGSYRAVGNFLTILLAATRRHNLPAYGFTFTLQAKKVKGEKGTFWTPVFSRPEPIQERAQIELLAGIRTACASTDEEGE